MPIESKFKINNFSPNFRDALLSRNLVADSIKDNSLTGWLDSVNKPAATVNPKGESVLASPNIQTTGPEFRKNDIKHNKAEYISKDYRGINIPFITRSVYPIRESYADYAAEPINSPTRYGPAYNVENTIFNLFKEGTTTYYSNELIKYDTVDTSTTNTKLTELDVKHSPESRVSNKARQANTSQNEFKSSNYERVSLTLLPFETNSVLAKLELNPNIYAPTLEEYTDKYVPANGPFQGGSIREFGTSKNMYYDVPKQTRTSIDTTSVTTQHTSYIDYNNAFGGGAASTQLIDVIGSALGGGGVGFDPNSGNPVPDFDVRSSLAGRALTATGLIDDTRLGQISPKYLAAAIGNNIAFNLQEETIGRVNLNPLSLAMGGKLIVPNYKITVGDSNLGLGVDIIERMTGAKLPVSLLPEEADIFTFGTKAYKGIGNIERAQAMLKNSGEGQVISLFANINSNVNPTLIGKRGGYAPGFKDSRTDSGIIRADGVEATRPYAFADSENYIRDFLIISPDNYPIAQSGYKLAGLTDNSEFREGPTNVANSKMNRKDGGYTDFIWSDDNNNKLARTTGTDELDSLLGESSFGKDFTVKKSLLFKTQELFNSNKMRTLVNGKGVLKHADDETSTTKSGFMSKGSAVLKGGGSNLGGGQNPEEVFARAWSPVDRYDQYKDLQKHSALSSEGRVDANIDVDSSVLGLNGIVNIAPDKNNKEIKKFMFSLENLAWDGQTNKLLDCEKGPGDLLNDTKGRIMWFPPYDMVINESTSANWDRTNFIGRGEPIYTYNNSERMGTLGFKIVVDHPNYLNFLGSANDDEMAAFFAGALSIEEIRNNVLNDDEKEAYKVAEINKDPKNQGVPPTTTPNFEFKLYFPNDDSEMPDSNYEDGITHASTLIDYDLYPNGIKYYTNSTEIDEAYGSGETLGEGIVGPKKQPYPDRTNFGLNGAQNEIRVPESPLGDPIELEGWYGFGGYNSDPKAWVDYFQVGNCKHCRFDIIGYASPQGNKTKNDILAKSRADNVKKHILENGFLKGVPTDLANKRISSSSEALTSTGCVGDMLGDNIICKNDRKVVVTVTFDHSLYLIDNPPPEFRDRNEPKPSQQIPLSRFYTECDYFEAIGAEDDSFISRDIKSKIKNFHPAFHAITPEGFNSRLTFLQQCMRQGPTTSGKENTPDNLAFGRPPVCILRIGDFYNTKIIIESLTIDYEPLVWDLNPEGVGVQPMIANVNLSFAFIGGSSLKGPINRLQNAVSFNYFANTELYDPRAERIRLKTAEELKANEKNNETSEFAIEEGRFPFPKSVVDEIAKTALDAQGRADFEARRQAEEEARTAARDAESVRLKATPDADSDAELLNLIRIESFNNAGEVVGFDLELTLDSRGAIEIPYPASDGPDSLGLSAEYGGEVYLNNSETDELITIGFIRAIPEQWEYEGDKSFIIEAQSHNGDTDEISINLETTPNFYGIINFNLFDHPDYDIIMKMLEPCVIVTPLSPPDAFPTIPESTAGPLASTPPPDYLLRATETIKPCENGDHTLWFKIGADDSSWTNKSRQVYNETNNGYAPNTHSYLNTK